MTTTLDVLEEQLQGMKMRGRSGREVTRFLTLWKEKFYQWGIVILLLS